MIYYFRLFLFCIGLCLPLLADTNDLSHVQVKLLTEENSIQAGRPIWVALHLNIEKGWHVYWKNPGDAGLPLKLNWKLPEGFQADPLQWPFPEKFIFEDMVGFGYEDEVILLTRITPPDTLPNGSDIQLNGEVQWLVCSPQNCQPGSAPVHLSIKTSSDTPQVDKTAADIFQKARSKMPKSQVQVTAIHKEGVLQLQIPELTSDSVTGVYFFPEQQNVIDPSFEPVVSDTAEPSKGYLVNLKGGEEIGVKSKNLKGVLVLQNHDEDILALNIDSPIQNDNEKEFLSLSDFNATSNPLRTSIGNSSFATSSHTSFEGGLALALGFAFLGGMLLNLMPCVLPVMSFKVMSFVKMARESRVLTIKHGLMFSVGVILSFWALAIVMLLLRTYGQAVGWGFQLQEPLFVVILASLLFIFALSLFGVFEWGLFLASWAGQTESDKTRQTSGYMASFFSGVMATAVATPCTGPFLGSAVGFAVTLPMYQSLMIFTSLGVGMCFPYLLLSIFPSCLRFIPKPGAWMETFKQLMGFLLLATVLWLLWVFSAQTNSLSLICLLGGFLCFSIGAWLYGKGCTPLISRSKRIIAYISVALMIVAGCEFILVPRTSWYEPLTVNHDKWEGWETFTPQRVAELRKEGKPFLIDFTAKWCLICQTNHLVLTSDEVTRKLAEAGVVKLKADWTKSDPAITEELSKYGRTSVPLYVLYGNDPKQEPAILPQVLTPDIVLDHLSSTYDSQVALE